MENSYAFYGFLKKLEKKKKEVQTQKIRKDGCTWSSFYPLGAIFRIAFHLYVLHTTFPI